MPRSSNHFWPVYPLFLFSGFPALLYQIVWQRSLFTLFGTNIESITLVVAAFMLGLGLGSLIGGKLSTLRLLPQLLLFALLELCIGLFGLVSLQLYDLVGSYAINLDYLSMTLVAFLLVFLPTLCMGATLPILSAFLVARMPNVGFSLGTLYFVNTLGSAIAAFSASLFLLGMYGMQGTIYVACLFNFLIGAAALLFHFWQKSTANEVVDTATKQDESRDLAENAISLRKILLLAFVSGFIALSYEILWMRIFSFANAGTAFIFPRVLGLFLLGLALGSYVAGRVCERLKDDTLQINRLLKLSMVFASLLGFFLMPLAAYLATQAALLFAELYLLVAALALGIPFPLLAHIGIKADKMSGQKISYMYMSNIAGATIGTVLTGFVLMDYLPTQTIAMLLAIGGLLIAATLVDTEKGRSRSSSIALAVLALTFLASNPALSRGNYEKFQAIRNYAGIPFKHIVETKSGVITVTQNDRVYGGGVYDGLFNTDLITDNNGIIRPYILSAFHPEPKRVLMIGLATGSWAQILAHHPALEQLVVVEINPGYSEIVATNTAVSSLLTNEKVEIRIDDGRRYMQRNATEKFDLIIMNTTFHWRAYAANLLSQDFLKIVLSRLNDGGIAFYNSTNSMNVQKTAATVCPHSLRFQNHMLCGNEEIAVDTQRLESILWNYEIDGIRQHDRSKERNRNRIAEIIEMFDASRYGFNTAVDFTTYPLESATSILERTEDNFIITDDNMGDEWN
ncbi:MAG: spermidine synthase [SAR86 cluster bacterium]|uniref:Spermidine synthase n=1 Tax=SAR86 cluster bacterium TaxID=2030880 RepID=A0A2A4X4N4_9GAMM|nr:MAG: spermidine synthase [SAR86 cluster bacterium]